MHGVADTIVEKAQCDGWASAIYSDLDADAQPRTAALEDARSADWQYLVEDRERRAALVLGCGFGEVPVRLAKRFGVVYAADRDRKRTEFLRLRSGQQSIANIRVENLAAGHHLPYADGQFDLVSAESDDWPVRELFRVVRPGGALHLNAPNRLSFERLLGKPRPKGQTARGYARLLRKSGFAGVRFYAPLPAGAASPLFYLPLASGGALAFFCRNTLALMDTVSPEVKRRYAREYAVGKLAARLALALGLTGMMRFFVPAFTILATRPAEDA